MNDENDRRARRDLFAAAAMLGLLAHGYGNVKYANVIARNAIDYADALMIALEIVPLACFAGAIVFAIVAIMTKK